MTDTARWILAFDSSCGRCARISASVAQTCDGKLEVVSLARPEIARWRELSLGPNPRWAPTLLRVNDKRVQGWTGLSMVGPMIRALGLRSTINVLRTLGRQQTELTGNRPEPSVGLGYWRWALLIETQCDRLGARLPYHRQAVEMGYKS